VTPTPGPDDPAGGGDEGGGAGSGGPPPPEGGTDVLAGAGASAPTALPEAAAAVEPPTTAGDVLAAATATATVGSSPLVSATETIRDLVGTAAGGTTVTADALRTELRTSLGEVGRDLTTRFDDAGARLADPAGTPARDLTVPAGILALFGAYLAATRWLDRGRLPMTVADAREDDVKLVL
jgi:hypothetical protein